METLALTFASGWASGVNAYLVLLVLGVAERVSPMAQIPDALGRWEVLVAAGVMYAVEFVADKVPYVDSAWDAVSTVIRPLVGGWVGFLIAGDSAALNEVIGGVVGGSSALAAHTVKSGTRLAVNTSPEPFTNIGLSLGEDSAVLVVMWFAIDHPYLAASVAAVLLVIGLVLLVLAIKLIRKGWAKFRAWRDRRKGVTAPMPH